MPGPARDPAIHGTLGPDDGLGPYVPDLAIDWLAESPDSQHRRVSGSMAFVDISGFTPLTERLTRQGKVGSEELSDILDSTFTALLEQTRREDADLVKWGGDAVLLLFQGAQHAARAVRATAAMRRALYSVGRTRSSAGRVTLRMSVGIHSGEFDFFLVGDPAIHRELIVSGPAASRTAEMEGAATAGQILISPETAADLPRSAVVERDDGMLLVRRVPAPPVGLTGPPSDRAAEIGNSDAIAGLIPPPVRQHLLAAAGESEHRTIAVGFIQFSGTDAHLASEGPEALAAALDDVVRNVQSACAAHDVTFLESDINRDGGKIMLVAGAPGLSEDVERRMLAATRLVVDRAGRLPLRVGVNRGRVFASDFGPSFRRTYSVKGDAINVAARVMGKSQPGQVLAVREVVARAGPGIGAVDVPPFLVKGKSRPIQAALILSTTDEQLSSPAQAAADQHLHEPELQVFTGALDRARQGRGTWVELIADAGLGKSSLLQQVCDAAEGFVVARGTSGRFGGATAHQAVRRLLRDVVGASPNATAAQLEDTLLASVRAHAPELEPWAPLLATVLGFTLPETPELHDLDERFRPAKLASVVVDLLRAVLTTPTLLIFEGADRMDESSADVVRDLVAQVRDRPWVVITARRPGQGGLTAADDESVTRVELAPLDDAASLAFLVSLSADNPVSDHLLRRIAAKAGGNPLFLRALFDAARTSTTDELPDSIDTLVGGQIDRLTPRLRSILRFAAVLGERFAIGDLREMVAAEGWAVERSDLDELRGFVEPEGPVEGWFRFGNAVMRDVAYAGLPYRLRRTMHRRVGEVLERAGNLEADSERLSTHFFEAGDHARAWTYSRQAGDHARHAFSYPEAMALYDRAISSAREVSPDELATVLESKGDVAELAGLSRQAIDAYRRAKKLVRSDALSYASLSVKETRLHQRMGAFVTASRISSLARARIQTVPGVEAAATRSMLAGRVAVIHHLRSRHADALRWSRVALDEAKESDDPLALAFAYNYRELIVTAAGERPEEPYGDLALANYTAAGDLVGQGHGLTNLAIRSVADGDWDTAVSRFEAATELFHRVGDTASEANAMYNRSDVLQRQARYDEAEPLLLEARRGALVTDDPELVALVDRELGKVRLGQGRLAEAQTLLESARGSLGELGLQAEAVDAAVALTHVSLAAGDLRKARGMATALLADAVAAGADELLARIHWLLGTALMLAEEWDTAQAAFAAGRDAAALWDGGHVRALNLLGLAAVADHTGHDRSSEAVEARTCLHRLGVVRLPAPFDSRTLPGELTQ